MLQSARVTFIVSGHAALCRAVICYHQIISHFSFSRVCVCVMCVSSVLRSIRVDSPLTSVDFTPDGTGLVVGSTQGKIYQYDLRNSSTPTRITVAHKTSVTCLRFQSNVGKHKVPADNSTHRINMRTVK